jgi:hypothetical protein
MGGSYQEALQVPIETIYRYMDFANEEEIVKQMKASTNAQPQ